MVSVNRKTALYSHALSMLHDMGPGHPESPARLQAINEFLPEQPWYEELVQLEPPPAGKEHLCRVHDADYVERIFSLVPANGLVHLDGDTAMNPHSLQAALLAAGAAVDAIDRIIAGDLQRAFCAFRPPGHHAEHSRAMGFCLFGNVAVAAAHALEHHGLQRVAVLDFDVHHGNGTEDLLRDDPRVLFCSSYQHPFYPYSDLHNAAENASHVPLPVGTGSEAFRAAIDREWWQALQRHEPDLILVSAGFDAHRDDPLAGLLLDEDDFRWITTQIVEQAERLCDGRIVSCLEGGYNTSALARSVAAHLGALL